MQFGFEVKLQHRALGDPYGGPGPSPGSVATFGQLHSSESEHGFYPKVGLKTEPL